MTTIRILKPEDVTLPEPMLLNIDREEAEENYQNVKNDYKITLCKECGTTARYCVDAERRSDNGEGSRFDGLHRARLLHADAARSAEGEGNVGARRSDG